jgi:hypothetical protein
MAVLRWKPQPFCPDKHNGWGNQSSTAASGCLTKTTLLKEIVS